MRAEGRVVSDDYLKRSGINITPDHEADHLAMGMSLIASTRGVGLLPAYAQNFLPWSVTSRPLKGDAPTIELEVPIPTQRSKMNLKTSASTIVPASTDIGRGDQLRFPAGGVATKTSDTK